MAPRADGRTPNRVVRIDDKTWEEFGLACDELGTNRSDEIRRHVKAVIATWKREQRQLARDAPTASASAKD